VAQAARLGGVACFDQIVVAYNDGLRFEREVSTARALGYSGKMCIHPAQVDLANTGFTPGPDEIDRARRLLAAAAEGRRHGLGAVGFEGQMIDAPLIAQAEAIMGAVDGA